MRKAEWRTMADQRARRKEQSSRGDREIDHVIADSGIDCIRFQRFQELDGSRFLARTDPRIDFCNINSGGGQVMPRFNQLSQQLLAVMP